MIPDKLMLICIILLSSLGYAVTSLTDSTYEDWPVRSFRSSPAKPPFMNITKNGPTATGHVFLTPSTIPVKGGHPMIFDNEGELVWQGPGGSVSYFRPQELNGEPVLTYWSGNESARGFGFGVIHVLDRSYEEIHRVTLLGNRTWVLPFMSELPLYIDSHENEFTDQDSIIVTAVNVTYVESPQDLDLPLQVDWLQDGQVYEIDLRSNEILFRWSMLEHPEAMHPSQSSHLIREGEGTSQALAWDFAHVNGATRYGDQYILSAKRSDSLYCVSSNGTVQWRLNGQTGGDFTLGPGTHFAAQHNPRVLWHTHDSLTILLHNNAQSFFGTTASQTTGLVLDIDLESKTVALNRTVYDSADPVYSIAEGTYQSLPSGHVFMGHGFVPKFEEYDDRGACVMRGRLGHDNSQTTYSAFRAPWVGTPNTPPSVFACTSDAATRLYISWNGATDVQAWEIWAGYGARTGLAYVTTSRRGGFETLARLDGLYSSIMVMAVGGPNHGRKSETINALRPC